jgi:hypothetical protein
MLGVTPNKGFPLLGGGRIDRCQDSETECYGSAGNIPIPPRSLTWDPPHFVMLVVPRTTNEKQGMFLTKTSPRVVFSSHCQHQHDVCQ